MENKDTKKLTEELIPSGDNFDLLNNIFKKTIAYELEGIRINDDGSTTRLHSERFMDEHPERTDGPEYTEAEEKEFHEDLKKWSEEFWDEIDKQPLEVKATLLKASQPSSNERINTENPLTVHEISEETIKRKTVCAESGGQEDI